MNLKQTCPKASVMRRVDVQLLLGAHNGSNVLRPDETKRTGVTTENNCQQIVGLVGR